MRISWAEIDCQAIRNNIQLVQNRVRPAGIVAVVKANAYGHGILEIAREAALSGVDCLGVGFLEEGLLLRKNGVTTPILVLGGVLFEQVKKFLTNDLEITVSSLGLAYAVNREAERLGMRAKIHLKFDTGLNRIGINYKKAMLVFERLKPLKSIDILGIYSHFASADEAHPEFTNLQLERFRAIVHAAENYGFEIPYHHIACSGAILQHTSSFFNTVRLGLAMYGLYPSQDFKRKSDLDLHPAMAFKSRIVYLKDVDEGEPVSYGRTYYVQSRTKIATIPVGYGDGYNRLLSNRGSVLINGRRVPVVGRICMDQFMTELGPDTEARIGDEVVLYGRQGQEFISIEEIAEQIGTIPYEVTCWLARRVPRIYINKS